MRRQLSLFEANRTTLAESLRATEESLTVYGASHRHWAIAYSGGKDSTAVVTVVVHLIEAGRVPKPESLTVLYADTRMELPPLHSAAMGVMDRLRERGIDARVVLPPVDERFFPYMLGRGVPPPKNRFRWCTSQIKVEPMIAALQGLRREAGEKLLMLTGVRLGESQARDARIALSCSKDGAECGQGYFQQATPEAVADTLAPLVHWRVCHVWDWLTFWAPGDGFPTSQVADVYGGDEAYENNARTGCAGCNLTSDDHALNTLLKNPKWEYLRPLKKLRVLYTELLKHHNRLRKGNDERRVDGTVVLNPGRIGPLTLDARRRGLAVVMGIQTEINAIALAEDKPTVDLINSEEYWRINELIDANTWPNRWTGEEMNGGQQIETLFPDGSVQPIFGFV